MDTVTLTIDGKPVTVEKGKTVLQAAIEHGIKVPYYCYHPGLGIDGSCRVCIVKIEKMAKLQTACSTPVRRGHGRHDPDARRRRGARERVRVPADQSPARLPGVRQGRRVSAAGFLVQFGPNESRMEFPRRVFDGEGVKADVDFGPTLMLNRNRCILCTRCVRFMSEVDADAQIGIVDRGYGSEIATFEEEGVHSLLSGNLMDVCPVGAITTRDYRFKSRPWDNPEAVDTICTLCEKGCNTTAWIKAKPEWAKGARLVRMTPRFNPDVNSYWMCDIGRFDYHWVEGDRRLRAAAASRRGTAQRRRRPWADALVDVKDARRRGAADPRRCASSSRRTRRSKSCSCCGRLGGAFNCPSGVAHQLAARATKPQPPNTKFKIPAGRRAERARRARPRLPGRAPTATGEPISSGSGADVDAGQRARALRVRSRPGRLDRRRVVDHRRAAVRQDPDCSSCRACC